METLLEISGLLCLRVGDQKVDTGMEVVPTELLRGSFQCGYPDRPRLGASWYGEIRALGLSRSGWFRPPIRVPRTAE